MSIKLPAMVKIVVRKCMVIFRLVDILIKYLKLFIYAIFNLEEKDCRIVSSRGILTSCDVFSKNLNFAIRNLSPDMHIRIFENSIVYVQSSSLSIFIKEVFPKIQHRFVLVTGDFDSEIPWDFFNTESDLKIFLNDSRLIHWYSQNCVYTCEKLSGIPIGLDYHTLKFNKNWWGSQQSPKYQETMLNTIRNRYNFFERETKCYANFHFLMTTRYSDDRKEALNEVPNELVFYEPQRVARKLTWTNQAQFKFVISPQGNGRDCHRTWEALSLSCIPIVKTSDIDYLFTDLPVLIVDKWSDISEYLLKATVEKFAEQIVSGEYLNKSMTLEYWNSVIHDTQ